MSISMPSIKGNYHRTQKIKIWGIWIILGAGSIIMLIPFYWLIITSFKEQKEILRIIKSNIPELRQIYSILAIIKKRIEEKTKLIDKLGLLRIIV